MVRGAVLVATIATAPPTLAALLAFIGGRSADRRAGAERAAVVSKSLDGLTDAVTRVDTKVDRVEAKVDRVEGVVVELRERVARLEGSRSLPGA